MHAEVADHTRRHLENWSVPGSLRQHRRASDTVAGFAAFSAALGIGQPLSLDIDLGEAMHANSSCPPWVPSRWPGSLRLATAGPPCSAGMAVLQVVPAWGGTVSFMPVYRNTIDRNQFLNVQLPYQLRVSDFEAAMQDVYDFFFDVNSNLVDRGLSRLDDMLRPAALSGLLSDMLTESLARHSRSLTQNTYFNGHPDLVVRGVYPDDSARSGDQGLEVKSTRRRGGAVDTHGARDQWMSVFVYTVDNTTEPAVDRQPLTFTAVYVASVTTDDFRRNERGELGTRTATLHADGLKKLRSGLLYRAQGSN